MVQIFIVLCPGGVDGRPLFGIECSVLNRRLIGDFGHLTAEGIDFFHQLSFGHAADGGAAWHGSDFVDIDTHEQYAASHACGGKGGFTSGMACADNDNIIFFVVKSHFELFYNV